MSTDELDVDAELLAMAGDDSSDEGSDAGEVVDQTQVVSARSPSPPPKASVEKSEDPSTTTRRGIAQKVRKRGRKKVTRREIQDELNDLADSPSPDASPGSEAMSESPPDSPGGVALSPVDDEPIFPVDGQFYSASDRDHILSLPEIERESILADRAAQSLKKQQDEKLKELLASQAPKHKRKAAAADLDEESRKSSRPKTESAGRSALDNYKKAREAKGAERTSRFDVKKDRRQDSRSPSLASDRDADGESEVEWADTTSSRRDEPPAEMKDFERCRVGRTNFAKVCFYPNFEETMKGCYCRVSIGMNRDTGQNMYRMTQIKGFTEGKPYMLEAGPKAKSFMCDIYAVVAHGAAEKPWPLSACSDSKLSTDEFQRYIETMQKEKLRVPKKAALVQKLDDIHRFLNPQWDDNALNLKFNKQRQMEKRLDPANASQMKKEAILDRKTEAEEQRDDEEVSRCDAELAALENNAATNGSAIRPVIRASPAKSQTMSQQDRLAILNRKNRNKTSDEISRALLEERRKRDQAIKDAKAKKAADEEAKRQAELLAVPHTDLKELFGDLSDLSRAGTPMSGVSTPKLRRSRQGTPMNGVVREKSKLGPGKKMKDGEGDELAELDLGIDVEI